MDSRSIGLNLLAERFIAKVGPSREKGGCRLPTLYIPFLVPLHHSGVMNELAAKPQVSHSGLTMVSSRTAPTILVVDDHEDTRALLRYILERQRYVVTEASDGAEAVLLAEVIVPDLIIMDTSLKNMDGLEATRRIRRLTNIGDVPIVFLSGHAQPQARAVALASGANEYLVKPISLEQLEIVVERQLFQAF